MSEVLLAYYLREMTRLLKELEDMNSKFAATQEFLKQRGLTNVRELDALGREDLLKHLHHALRKLQN